MRPCGWWRLALIGAIALLYLPDPVPAQQPPALPTETIGLERAIELAEARNQQITVALSGVRRAEGNEQQARSGFFPQLFGSASYDRTLHSEFQGIFGGSSGPA
ncbi:MAG: hypothetical protein EHM13_12200, partial [Acidobacteria bacterium]